MPCILKHGVIDGFGVVLSRYRWIISFNFMFCFLAFHLFSRNELARKLAKDFLLDLQSGTLDL